MMKITDLFYYEMFIAFFVVIAICLIGLIITDYWEYRIMKEQSDKFKKNIKLYDNTIAGALENDRVNEREKK